MNLYNILNGVNPCTFLILPMLGKPLEEYPRFRDCFLGDEERPEYDNYIHIYTRTGGGNRERYKSENQEMMDMKGFIVDYDDSFDSTYASWVFEVPEKWKPDFDRIKGWRLSEVSKEYQDELRRVCPKLDSQFGEIFFAQADANQWEGQRENYRSGAGAPLPVAES